MTAEALRRDPLRPVAPVVAAAVAVLAAVTDPAAPGLVALLAAAAALFVPWALWPAAVPAPVLGAGVLGGVVLAKGSGDLDVGLFLVSLLVIVVAGTVSGPMVVLVTLAALAVPFVVELRNPGDIDIGIWLVGIAFPGLMSWLLRRQDELRAELAETRGRIVAQSVAEERRRIARDVHDLVGHGLAAVLLQVAGARHVLRRDPDDADAALAAAEDAGRRSLHELRSTVALLRGAGDSALSAVPGLAQLPRLVDEARATGATVEHRARGDLEGVDPMVGLAVYRVAQEALLNAARHAPAGCTTVEVVVDGGRVALDVHSHGPVTPPTVRRDGYGLVGMRERAAAVGGCVDAGPDGAGWRVRCVVPASGGAP